MSTIIYGPKGCGKTINAEKLRKHFGCDKIVDDGRYPYPKSRQQDAKFKAGNDLFLTYEDPPHHLKDGQRRIFSFDVAMSLLSIKEYTAFHQPT